MIPQERYEQIKSILTKEKTISLKDLSKEIFVSESTLRRDIDYLENAGFLKKIRGGVTISSNINGEYSSFIRQNRNTEEKQYMASLCDKYFLKDDLSMFLDDSSTTSYLTKYIKNYKQMVVLTHSIEIAKNLYESSNVKCLLSGGTLKFNSFSLVGLQVYDFLKSFYADYLFVSCKCLDSKNIYEADSELAGIKKIMLNNSSKKVLLADSSKFDKKSFVSNYKPTQFDYIITDKKPSDAFINSLKPFTEVIWE
ncbi:MAG: DeoR/GlpR family DNA-binding transcription regulator [Anaerococcus sp.]|nr:DeoR/GlpR family DNA-binding transcription regulator [Anaerococcus sp.]